MFLNPKKVLDHLRVPYGAKVGDFGAGAGHYSLHLLDRLEGAGAVYAFDAFAPGLDAISRRAKEKNTAFYALSSDLNSHIPLKDGLLKVGVAANILHQLSNHGRFAEEVYRVLSPGGSLLVVDWASSFRNMGPTHEAVFAPADAARLFQTIGFDVGEMLPAGTHHFAFIARKSDD